MSIDTRQVPDDAKRTPREYVIDLWNSDRVRLLVEGPTDRELFRRLLSAAAPTRASEIDIDHAEQLKSGGPPADPAEGGNCGLVRQTVRLATEQGVSDRLVGFIDREYDRFTLRPVLADDDPCDRVDGRLVRARGHSMENYLFDFAAFGDRMREYIPADQLDSTLRLFERVFPDAVRVACAVGLTGYNHPIERRLRALETSVEWECLDISPLEGRMALNVEAWARVLIGRKGQPDWVAAAAHEFTLWWPAVRMAEYGVIRWLCHGHIGFEVIWSAFVRCVHDCCNSLPPSERKQIVQDVQRDRRGQSDMRFRAVVDHWVRHALQGRLDCPRVIFGLLGLPEPTAFPAGAV